MPDERRCEKCEEWHDCLEIDGQAVCSLKDCVVAWDYCCPHFTPLTVDGKGAAAGERGDEG